MIEEEKEEKEITVNRFGYFNRMDEWMWVDGWMEWRKLLSFSATTSLHEGSDNKWMDGRGGSAQRGRRSNQNRSSSSSNNFIAHLRIFLIVPN